MERTLTVIEWKRTEGHYVAVLQALSRFQPGSIRQYSRQGFETVLVGRLSGQTDEDWYAIAYDRRELEFDEAREKAKEAAKNLSQMRP